MNDIKITKFNSRIHLYLIMFRERDGFKLSFPRRSRGTPAREGKLAFGLLGVHYLLESLLGKIRKNLIAISVIKIADLD